MSEKMYPEPIVGALVFNQEGKIFLLASPKWQGKYGLPGGHIELDENIEQAIKRELKEETNLAVFDIQFLMTQECIFSEEFYKKKHFIFLDYICKAKNEDVVLDGREGTGHVWVTIDESLKLSLNPYTKNTILEYKNRHLNK
ncbi:MAG: ADP-ribose pyrophosphatase [Candidatus Nealsonbacteria bacterium CG_4_8_14_3_um_filter_40_11]|uniref:ADP-ribose pyrophosphatase n=1 Tax=Candidatus Nealsonbacteria bacterium CG_4_8_14_3_um_filter_40_11 TaxID=1974690 RepID=A0A2M7IKP4_9BACT|nr:MAG: ADP-ribose pyrophosphatase [Candidatus Nealsonbacteria bacterium CG_4_8_14_3_um_filter_40_11]